MLNDIKWIECNLPWYTSSNGLMLPDLSSREEEVFGTTLEKEEEKLIQFGNDCWVKFSQIKCDIERKLTEKYDGKLLLEKVNDELIEISKVNKLIETVLKLDSYRVKRDNWFYGQPEVIEWENKCEENHAATKISSFCGLNLNEPGVLIEMETGEQYLIGHINVISGVCDDCTAFESNAIVKRYAVLYNFD